jgi:hypothetical protein
MVQRALLPSTPSLACADYPVYQAILGQLARPPWRIHQIHVVAPPSVETTQERLHLRGARFTFRASFGLLGHDITLALLL